MKTSLFKRTKDLFDYILFSNKFYRILLAPFDRIEFPVVNKDELVKKKQAEPVPYNKIPNVADLTNETWGKVLHETRDFLGMAPENFHRKRWEHIQIIYILQQEGFLHPENVCLSVGAGTEHTLFYLTHKVSQVVGVDLYRGEYYGQEDEPDTPLHPDKYAPFLYPQEKLELRNMDARNLEFESNSFDFIFSASSIEHFGSIKDIETALKEMYRVLKPGGALALTTEIKLNRLGRDIPNTKIFAVESLIQLYIKCGFELKEEDINIEIEDHYLYNWIKLIREIYKTPHVILRFLHTIFTSFSTLLIKPGDEVKKAHSGKEFQCTPMDYSHKLDIKLENSTLAKKQSAFLTIAVKNTSNFRWYTEGGSHRIIIGVRLLDQHGNFLRELKEIFIPQPTVEKEAEVCFQAEYKLRIKRGAYKLFFDIKRELVTWFHEHGSTPCVLDIEIR